MLNLVIRQLQKRLDWARHDRILHGVATREQFDAVLVRVVPKNFLQYRAASGEKRREFLSVIETLRLDLRGKAFLDVGPGYGDALDVAHEIGATRIDFVEYDPFFFTHNRLKPYARGFRVNHMFGLKPVPANTYDLVWVKGSIVADFFIRARWLSADARWFEQLRQRAKPGGDIVVCPYWNVRGGRRCHVDVLTSPFTRRMLDRGYEMVPPIPDHNTEPIYPVTFRRRVPER